MGTVKDGLAADQPPAAAGRLAAAQVHEQRERRHAAGAQIHAVVKVAPKALPLYIPARSAPHQLPHSTLAEQSGHNQDVDARSQHVVPLDECQTELYACAHRLGPRHCPSGARSAAHYKYQRAQKQQGSAGR